MEDCTGQYTCKQFSTNDCQAKCNMSDRNRNPRNNEIFQRFVLVSDQQSMAKFSFMPSAPTPPPLCLQIFLDFPVFSFSFPRNWPLKKLCQHLFHQILHRPWSSLVKRERLLHIFWYLRPWFIFTYSRAIDPFKSIVSFGKKSQSI